MSWNKCSNYNMQGATTKTTILLHNVQDYCIPVPDPLSHNNGIYMSLIQLSEVTHCLTVFTFIR